MCYLFLFELCVRSFPYLFSCFSFCPFFLFRFFLSCLSSFLSALFLSYCFCSYVFLLYVWEWRIPKTMAFNTKMVECLIICRCRSIWGNIHFDDKCWENEALYPVVIKHPGRNNDFADDLHILEPIPAVFNVFFFFFYGIRWVRRVSRRKESQLWDGKHK